MHPALASADLEEVVKWRHYLHAHPELAFEEQVTSQFVAERLASWGLSVRRGYFDDALLPIGSSYWAHLIESSLPA